MRVRRKAAIAGLALLAAAAATRAQSSTGEVNGTVTGAAFDSIESKSPCVVQSGRAVHHSLLCWANRSPMCTTALPGGFPAFGNLGVGVLRDQFFYNVDFSIAKSFRISQGKSLQIRGEAFNVFNMQIFGTPGADVTSGTLGVIHSIASTPRELQLGAKFVF